MKLPFYVVKAGPLYFGDIGWRTRQRDAKPFPSRALAEVVVKRRQHPLVGPCRVVLVWPRLRAPKLPAWVKPAVLGDRQIAVFTRGPGWVEEHVFFVHPKNSSALVGHVAPVEWFIHEPKRRVKCGTFTQAAPEVWIEAACRAKALVLRGKRGGK